MKNLAQNVVALLASCGGFFVAAIFLVFILFQALNKGHRRFEDQIHLIGPFVFSILAVLGCIGLALYVWYLVVLHQTRSAVSRHLSGS